MSGDTPKVRDYSSQERMIPVLVEASPVYELLLSLFAYGSKNDWTEYECGSTFFEQFQDTVPEPLLTESPSSPSAVRCGSPWSQLPMTPASLLRLTNL